jgi:phosphomannomutase
MPASDLIVSVSGIRGVIGDSLTPEPAGRFAAALGTFLHGGKVVLSRDSRPSGDMLKHAVLSGLLSVGCTVEDIGIAATPTVGIAVRQLHAAGAIQITASHNPAPWNGLKMFGSDGAVLPAALGQQVKMIYDSQAFHRATWDKLGSVRIPPGPDDDHLRLVLDNVSPSKIATGGFRVFLDANAGAGGPLGLKLLGELGCEVVQFGCEPDGHFLHEPEPTPAHLTDVAPWVKQHSAHVGFVLDPDSDRLALIDETGTCVSEELTLALAVKFRLRSVTGPVVVNMSTSRVIEDIAVAAGCEFARSAVGEANVVELMRTTNAVIGGEGNGGVIDPRIGWVRDPFIGMAQILNLMAEERKPLSQLIAELPAYSMLKTKFAVSRERLPSALAALTAAFPTATANTVDGLRLDGPDWWLHVRGSNTEPVVRVIAEAPTEARATELCRQAGALFG